MNVFNHNNLGVPPISSLNIWLIYLDATKQAYLNEWTLSEQND